MVMQKVRISIMLLAVLTLSAGNGLFAQDIAQRQKAFNLDENHVALQGYDVVSYFMGEPVKGKKSLPVEYLGVTYLFSSADNRALFQKQPEKFEPMYGGWCAYAIGVSGEKVKIDPKTFKIIGGRLYLFYNFYFNNTLIDWNKDEQALKAKADANWQKIMATQ